MYFRVVTLGSSLAAVLGMGCGIGGGGGGSGPGDGLPALSIQDVHAKQGQDLPFVLELDRPLQTDLTLTYSTATVDATVPDDFHPTASAQVTIPAGQSTVALAVPTYFTRLLDAPHEVSLDIAASDAIHIQRGHASGFIDPRAKVIDHFAQIGTGDGYACAITTTGGVQCWGKTPRATDVMGLNGNVTSVSVAGTSACALTAQGSVSCWNEGQAATAVTGLSSGVTAISVGSGHNCAVVNGGVKCWGLNLSGELGDGTQTGSDVPVQVSGLTAGYVSVDAGGLAHSCALNSAGGVKCWGHNSDGELGIGNDSNFSLLPGQVVGLTSGVKAISLGSFDSCALKTDGTTVCWGDNVRADGANGGEYYLNALAPDPVTLVGSNAAMSARSYGGYVLGLCGLDGQGTLRCISDLPAKYAVVETDVVAFSDYDYSRCSLVSGGRVRCAGSATHLTAFQGASLQTPMVPMDVGADAKTTSGRCSVSPTGAVSCLDKSGKLAAVPELASDVREVVASEFRACAIKTNGQVLCWTTSTPVPVAPPGVGSNIKQLAIGSSHTCALSTEGAVSCWGSNRQGQLGVATLTGSDVPLAVPGLDHGVTAIAAGNFQTCAMVGTGGVRCWGNGRAGTLFDISNLAGATSVAVASTSGCATAQDGTLHCWGLNHVAKPVALPDASITSLVAGTGHFCVLTADHRMRCWGDNTWGQLGNNSGVAATTPTLVEGLHDVDSIGASGDATCAVSGPDGRVRCFGRIGTTPAADQPYILEYF